MNKLANCHPIDALDDFGARLSVFYALSHAALDCYSIMERDPNGIAYEPPITEEHARALRALHDDFEEVRALVAAWCEKYAPDLTHAGGA